MQVQKMFVKAIFSVYFLCAFAFSSVIQAEQTLYPLPLERSQTATPPTRMPVCNFMLYYNECPQDFVVFPCQVFTTSQEEIMHLSSLFLELHVNIEKAKQSVDEENKLNQLFGWKKGTVFHLFPDNFGGLDHKKAFFPLDEIVQKGVLGPRFVAFSKELSLVNRTRLSITEIFLLKKAFAAVDRFQKRYQENLTLPQVAKKESKVSVSAKKRSIAFEQQQDLNFTGGCMLGGWIVLVLMKWTLSMMPAEKHILTSKKQSIKPLPKVINPSNRHLDQSSMLSTTPK